jgi:hypothetical protein
MQTRAVYTIVSALHFCAAIVTCDAAGRFDQSINTGQPRELINQPACWIAEGLAERQGCEIVGRVRSQF